MKARARRNFLKKSAIAGGAATLGRLVPVGVTNLPIAFSEVEAVQPSDDRAKMSCPTNGGVLKSFLTARLEWEYAVGRRF
jgi:hypothetical protein